MIACYFRTVDVILLRFRCSLFWSLIAFWVLVAVHLLPSDLLNDVNNFILKVSVQ
jgi:hypothetical protein